MGAVITAVGVVLSWFVKQVPRRDSDSLPPPTPEKAAEEVESLIP